METLELRGTNYPSEIIKFGVTYIKDCVVNGVTLFIQKNLVFHKEY